MRGFGRSPNADFIFSPGLRAEILSRESDGEVARVALSATGGVEESLEAAGSPPTPPYIRRGAEDSRAGIDRERYQTVFASVPGAVAAPTAGLHFTGALLETIRARGVEIGMLTLHVGWGTFAPVRVESIEDHHVDPERYEIGSRLAIAVGDAKRRGGRVIAVGTTVTRALEFAMGEDGHIRAGSGRCDLYIRPPHRFRAVDALVTNFHLPGSSLLILAAAFAGLDRILEAYREAVAMEYRFYSYGDAMLIL